MNRKILHIDMDAFFASVEILDNPSLKNKILVVGGEEGRGVVTTCNYKARKYGIHSAMPIYIARTLCGDIHIVKPRHYRYKEVSDKIFKYLCKFSNKIQKVSIDEAYIDISDTDYNPIKLAMQIKHEVKSNFGLTLSVGISFNKFLAKIASDMNKPNGIMEITEGNFKSILSNLDLSKVHGLGEKSIETLNFLGINKVSQMYDLSKAFYSEHFGKAGEEIYYRIRGIDNREVVNSYDRKSYGKEITFKEDVLLSNKFAIHEKINEFSKYISEYMITNGLCAKTLTFKIKTNDFQIHTKSKTFSSNLNTAKDIYINAMELFNSMQVSKPVRLIGLSISNFETEKAGQLSLFN